MRRRTPQLNRPFLGGPATLGAITPPGSTVPPAIGQPLVDTFGGALSASMDAIKTLLLDGAGGGETRGVLFQFASGATLTYVPGRAGHLVGYWATATQFAVGIGPAGFVDPTIYTGNLNEVVEGLVWGTSLGSAGIFIPMKVPIKETDVVKVKTTGTSCQAMLWFSF